MLKIGLVGLGVVSKIHIPIIEKQDNAKLVAVCDINNDLKSNYPYVNFYNNYKDMINNEKLDCVHICLPHYLHYEVTKFCVENGVNVFLEKPLALNYKEAIEINKIVEKNSVKVCLCLQNRLNETVEKLLEIKDSKKYGDIIGVKGLVSWYREKDYYDLNPWRKSMSEAGGGVMINQAIHTLDLMYKFCGEVESIKGNVSNLIYDIEVEDTASANINFKNGARGLFFATVANVDNSSVELEILFEKGKFIIKDSKLVKINEDGSRIEIMEDSKLEGSKFYYGASHKKLIAKFYDCLINNDERYIHLSEGIESIKMIDCIRKSSNLNKLVRMEDL